MKVTVVAGNPKPQSRTLDAARLLAAAATGRDADEIVDVITLGPGLLGWGDEGVAAAVEKTRVSDLVVFASPTFKGSFTGVLKLFLDQFATGSGLRDVVAIPLMLGAGPGHAMAPMYLEQVLRELGATLPAPGLYLLDSEYATSSAIADYAARWGSVLKVSVPDRTDAR
ncbi:NADPH-dependent FMN reductase [Nocardia jinanensis]|uniref:FMN reductase n=1 Tax=Nocardia jinanensis TaxID=382504 RepID=A0A917REK3_9NOCA|nr:NAD(P)H-dependent oxidoreductase [Nocardia jinanensis]GGL02398.1 FMN reductase [Nocardia jinanensis]